MHRTAATPRHLVVKHAQPVRWRGLSTLAAAIIGVDQLTKAIQPPGKFVVNLGGSRFVPDTVSDFLWKSQTFGALADTVGAALLVTALIYARRFATPARRAGATMTFAGLLSNVIDRLGAASLAHPGLPRGAVDWVSLGNFGTANLADVGIALGVLIYAADRLGSALRALGPRQTVRLTAAAAAITAIAVWANVWQANRYGAVTRHQLPVTYPATANAAVPGAQCLGASMPVPLPPTCLVVPPPTGP